MISTSIAGTAVWIVPFYPNTDGSLRLGVKIPVDVQRRLTGSSSRRPQDNTLRLTQEWSVTMRSVDFQKFFSASQIAQDEPIVTPLWLFAEPVATALQVSSGLTIAWTAGWVSWAINPSDLSGYTWHAPLLYGRFTQPPSLAGKNGEDVDVDIFFEEDGTAAFAIVPPTLSDTTFSTVSGYAAPVFPFIHEGSNLPKPGLAVIEVDRQVVGPGRIKSSMVYPQTPERTEEQTFKFNAAGAAQMLAWWQRRAGVADSHWVALSQQIGRLAADAAAGDNHFTFASTPLNGSNGEICLGSPTQFELARMSSLTGLTAGLTANLANSWRAPWTTVTLAMLARHTNEELVIEARRASPGWIAECTLSWREVAQEYTLPAGETRGVTTGRLPAPFWAFQFDLDYNGAVQTWRLTNWASGATVGGYTWTYSPCDYDKITSSIDLQDDSCTWSGDYFPGGPWDNWLPGQLSARGYLTVYRADVAPDGTFSNFAAVWSGELSTPSSEGSRISQKVLGANNRFTQQVPRQVMSTSCYKRHLKARCGLAESDWTFNAVISSITGNVVNVGTITRANGSALPSGFGGPNYFALGWLGWLALDPIAGTYTLPMRPAVLSSTLISSGHLTVTVERVTGLSVGQSVTLVPGCDRIGTTCSTKFGNHLRFGGFDYMPAINPGFVIPQKNSNSAKK